MMVDFTYIYDKNAADWLDDTDSPASLIDIDLLPIHVDIDFRGYDEEHHRMHLKKAVVKAGKYNYGLYQAIVLNEIDNSNDETILEYEIPLRWRLQKKDNDNTIRVGMEALIISRNELLNRKFGIYKKQIKFYDWYINIRDQYTYFYPGWNYNHSRSKNNIISPYTNDYIPHYFWLCGEYLYNEFRDCWLRKYPMPDIICNKIYELLSKDLIDIYGFAPTCNSRMPQPDNFYAYVIRPLDSHAEYMRYLMKNNKHDYNEILPKELTDCFTPLCQYLGISKPPKSLRQAYAKYAYAPVIYKFFIQIGFKDINIIQRFYHLTHLFGLKLSKFVYIKNVNELHYHNKEYFLAEKIDELEEAITQYIRIGIIRRGENVFSHQILKNNDSSYAQDIIRMFTCYTFDLSPDSIKKIFHKPFNSIMHDNLADEINLINDKDDMEEWIDYTPEELALECDIIVHNDLVYRVRLPKKSSDLAFIGKSMSNCVKGYTNAVKNKSCIIATATENGKYCACIEIRDNIIHQCSGPYNSIISGWTSLAISYWAKHNNLVYKTRIKQKITAENISIVPLQKNQAAEESNTGSFHPDLDYMLIQNEEMMTSLYFDKFLKILSKHKDEYRPDIRYTLNDFSNELSYLMCAMPKGETLFSRVYKGDSRAQQVLAYMYKHGCCLEQNIAHANYWFYKSIGLSEEICQRCLDGVDVQGNTPQEQGHYYGTLIKIFRAAQ